MAQGKYASDASGGKVVFTRGVETFMERNQMKVQWQGEVVSVQPRSTVWRYLIDNRTHRENGYNVFLKGEMCSNDEAIQLGNRFETFCYGPLSCKNYKMGPARAVPYKGMSGVKDQGWLDEICVEYRRDEDE